MGFRFRRSLRLAPGLRVNLSKSGASLSVGRRGATVNFGKRGTRTTVGLPGTGLSYSTMRARSSQTIPGSGRGVLANLGIALFAGGVAIGALALLNMLFHTIVR